MGLDRGRDGESRCALRSLTGKLGGHQPRNEYKHVEWLLSAAFTSAARLQVGMQHFWGSPPIFSPHPRAFGWPLCLPPVPSGFAHGPRRLLGPVVYWAPSSMGPVVYRMGPVAHLTVFSLPACALPWHPLQLHVAAQQAQRIAPLFKEQELSNVLWALGKMNLRDRPEVLEALMSETRAKLPAFLPQVGTWPRPGAARPAAPCAVISAA